VRFNALAQADRSRRHSSRKPKQAPRKQAPEGQSALAGFPWHFFHFFPEPQGHGSLRPISLDIKSNLRQLPIRDSQNLSPDQALLLIDVFTMVSIRSSV
jgi:hypothetical protein